MGCCSSQSAQSDPFVTSPPPPPVRPSSQTPSVTGHPVGSSALPMAPSQGQGQPRAVSWAPAPPGPESTVQGTFGTVPNPSNQPFSIGGTAAQVMVGDIMVPGNLPPAGFTH
eukprot:TRINITY_DN9209_c0_g1_i1.p2 TRINITY_DN9209_c0_g1~~TRINITY_DN9209_c0_g1_i1.p2  ORF type:complete len:124 (+),score=23.14 TRINITY_DN9209_c0_g1_i1:37-372(+)